MFDQTGDSSERAKSDCLKNEAQWILVNWHGYKKSY